MQLTRGFLYARISKNFRDHPKSSLHKVSLQIMLRTLSKEKLYKRSSRERSQTQ